MTRSRVAAVFAGLIPALACAGEASAIDCTCRAGGARYELGDTACLRTPAGPRLARCEMDQNVTSWKTLAVPCAVSQGRGWSPVALASPPAPLSPSRP